LTRSTTRLIDDLLQRDFKLFTAQSLKLQSPLLGFSDGLRFVERFQDSTRKEVVAPWMKGFYSSR
jgi:hypothetical protein